MISLGTSHCCVHLGSGSRQNNGQTKRTTPCFDPYAVHRLQNMNLQEFPVHHARGNRPRGPWPDLAKPFAKAETCLRLRSRKADGVSAYHLNGMSIYILRYDLPYSTAMMVIADLRQSQPNKISRCLLTARTKRRRRFPFLNAIPLFKSSARKSGRESTQVRQVATLFPDSAQSIRAASIERDCALDVSV